MSMPGVQHFLYNRRGLRLTYTPVFVKVHVFVDFNRKDR